MGKKTRKGFNDISNKGKVIMHEINIVKKMTNDIVKYFNKEEISWTNQKVTDVREVLVVL